MTHTSRLILYGTSPCWISRPALCVILGYPLADGLLPQASLCNEGLGYIMEENFEQGLGVGDVEQD